MVQWLRLCGSPAGGRDLISGWRLPCSSNGKESACKAEDQGSISGSGSSEKDIAAHSNILAWVLNISWSRKWQPTPVFLPGKFHVQRSLLRYSPWGHKESNMNEHTADRAKYPLLFSQVYRNSVPRIWRKVLIRPHSPSGPA